MKKQNIMILLIAVAMMVLVFPGSAAAADEDIWGTITVDSATNVKADETVTLKVTVSNVTNLGAFQVYVDNTSIPYERAFIQISEDDLPLTGDYTVGVGVGEYKGLPTVNWYTSNEKKTVNGKDVVFMSIDVTPKVEGDSFPVGLIFEAFGTHNEVEMKQHYTIVNGTVTTAGGAGPEAKEIEILEPAAGAEFSIGDKGTATANVLDAESKIIEGAAVSWTSSNDEVMTIDAGGNYTAVGDGSVDLTASYNTLTETVSVTVLAASSDFAGGAGTTDDPYQIATADQLDKVREYLDKSFILTDNIDLSGVDWVPISTFTGTFDGDGYTISNVDVVVTGSTPSGLFGITNGAGIKNLALNNVNVSQTANGYPSLGSLVGQMIGSSIDNVSIRNAVVAGRTYAGGLVGNAGDSTITNCSVEANVLGYNGAGSQHGGIAGNTGGYVGGGYSGDYVLTTITNCIASGSVAPGTATGGIVGQANANITNCIALNTLDGGQNTGGLVGSTQMGDITVKNSVALNRYINSSNSASGTIAGANSKITVTDSYAWAGIENSLGAFGTGGTAGTSAASAEVWDNFDFYENLGFDTEIWSAGTNENFKLPVIAGHPAMNTDAGYLAEGSSEEPTPLYEGTVTLMNNTLWLASPMDWTTLASYYYYPFLTDAGALATAALDGHLTFNATNEEYGSDTPYLWNIDDINGIKSDGEKLWYSFINEKWIDSQNITAVKDGDTVSFLYVKDPSAGYAAALADAGDNAVLLTVKKIENPLEIAEVTVQITEGTKINVQNGDSVWETNATSGAGLLAAAAQEAGFTYNCSDKGWLGDIAGISPDFSSTGYGWSYTLNGNSTDVLSSFEVQDGDTLTFSMLASTYGGMPVDKFTADTMGSILESNACSLTIHANVLKDPATVDDTIALISGWNYISVPKKLGSGSNTAADLFKNVDTEGRSMLLYDAETGKWVSITGSDIIEPLNAYWIYSASTRTVQFSYPKYPATPATKELSVGWNAIGLSAGEPISAGNALSGLKWRNLLPWDNTTGDFGTAIIYGTTGETSPDRLMTPKIGYWLYVTEPGKLIGLTA